MRDNIGLYRGKQNRDWVDGSLVSLDEGHAYIVPKYPYASTLTCVQLVEMTMRRVVPSTVGQYTGLTDRNGTRIFEGDIVKSADFDAEDGYAKIVWDAETARFVIEGQSVICDFDNYYGYELEVIGNIHDNPELIGGADNGPTDILVR